MLNEIFQSASAGRETVHGHETPLKDTDIVNQITVFQMRELVKEEIKKNPPPRDWIGRIGYVILVLIGLLSFAAVLSMTDQDVEKAARDIAATSDEIKARLSELPKAESVRFPEGRLPENLATKSDIESLKREIELNQIALKPREPTKEKEGAGEKKEIPSDEVASAIDSMRRINEELKLAMSQTKPRM